MHKDTITYINILTSAAKINEEILIVDADKDIIVNFKYEDKKHRIHLRWFLSIELAEENETHFPKTVVKGMLLLSVAKYIELSNLNTAITGEELMDSLEHDGIPSIDIFENISDLEFNL